MSDALETQTYRVTRADLVRYCGASGDFNVRFSRPVPVPDTDEGTEVVVSGVVKEVTEDGLTRLNLTAMAHGEKVLSLAQATIRKR